jgi:hypothetical protein
MSRSPYKVIEARGRLCRLVELPNGERRAIFLRRGETWRGYLETDTLTLKPETLPAAAAGAKAPSLIDTRKR